MPPPRVNLIIPKITAKPHITIPAIAELLDSSGSEFMAAIILIINPTEANGILIQLYAPRQGINPMSIPITDNIPQKRLMIFIIYFVNF